MQLGGALLLDGAFGTNRKSEEAANTTCEGINTDLFRRSYRVQDDVSAEPYEIPGVLSGTHNTSVAPGYEALQSLQGTALSYHQELRLPSQSRQVTWVTHA